jgi:hypothetical protein
LAGTGLSFGRADFPEVVHKDIDFVSMLDKGFVAFCH